MALIASTDSSSVNNHDEKLPSLVDVTYDEAEGCGNLLQAASLEV